MALCIPLYSRPCEQYHQLTVVLQNPLSRRLHANIFNPESRHFSKVICTCCPVFQNLKSLDSISTRGIRYERSHRDIDGNPLICLHVKFGSGDRQNYGQMDMFVREDGQIAEYQWNDEKKAFEVKKVYNHITLEEQACVGRWKEPEHITDDQILPTGTGYCEDHGSHLLTEDPDTKFRWNPYREQFEMITCNCKSVKCRPTVISDSCEMYLTVVASDGRKIEIMKNGSKLEKICTKQVEQTDVISVMKPEKVRDLRGKSVQVLQSLRTAEQQHHNLRNNWKFDVENIWYFTTGANGVPLYTDEAGKVGPYPEVDKKERNATYGAAVEVYNDSEDDSESEEADEFVYVDSEYSDEGS